MRRVIFATIFLFSTLVSDSVLLVKKGWQLIGSSTMLDMSKFKSKDVDEVWHFDANTQRWLGYSPNKDIQDKIKDNNVSTLKVLKPWHGFWIKSRRDWALTFPNSNLKSAPANENRSKDVIFLKKGWNLISLPIDSVVSANIFKGMVVWKYKNEKWRLYDDTKKSEDYPPINSIKNSNGLWVKATKDINISVMSESAKLHNFDSKDEMDRYIREMVILNSRKHWGYEPLYAIRAVNDNSPVYTTAVEDVGVKSATTTNLQESGVDEADIVKHNNKNLFYVVNDNRDSSIFITSFNRLSTNNQDSINKIDFKRKKIDSIYVVNNRLIVMSQKYSEEIISSPKNSTLTNVIVDIFDISDINSIQNISSYMIDGYIINSRVIGDNLYFISSFQPQVNVTYPKKYIELSTLCKEYFDRYRYNDNYVQAEPAVNQKEIAPIYTECYNINRDDGRYYRYDYDNPIVKIKQLTPKIEKDGTKEDLLKASKLYAPSKTNQVPTIISISNFSISSGDYRVTSSFIGDSYTEYASIKSLYLVSNKYPIYYSFDSYKKRSIIYKFDFDSDIKYKGKGEVYGHPLNQFSLSEYNSILRVATTDGFSWSPKGTDNSIYTLKEDSGRLKIEGVLRGLGKANETIKSVRFMGNRGFLVTFKQTDPLYTLDMSDPKAPKKMGELKVNGYSSYLHPIGENMLLGIGRDANKNGTLLGLKIELFDISDFANPTSLHSIKYKSNTSSELEYNHKALAYRASDNIFAFPYRFNGDQINSYTSSDNLGVYQIKDNRIIEYNPIKETDSKSWGQHRGVIFDKDNRTFVSFFKNSSIVTTKELNITE